MQTIKFRAWDGYTMYQVGAIELFTDDTYRINDEVPISNEHLMQFTGLKDKNGKEIYEGDIIENVEKWEIIFNKGCFCGKIINKTYPDTETHIALRAIRNIKIIGNIYEHSELLKQ